MKQKNKKNIFLKLEGLIFALFLFIVVGFFGRQAMAQTACQTPDDCAANQNCVNGKCVTPSSTGGSNSSNSCLTPEDCAANQNCVNGTCVTPSSSGGSSSSNSGQCNPACQSPDPICNPATGNCTDNLGLSTSGSACTPTNSPAGCPCSQSGNNCGVGLTCGVFNTCEQPSNSGTQGSSGAGSGSSGSSGASSGITGPCPDQMTRDPSSGFCLPTANPFPTTGIAASSSLTGLILSIIKFLLFFSGIVAVLFLIIGGFLYMSSGGNEEQAEKGKKTITNFALGLAVIIMAYAIVTILGNTLTDNKFNVTSSGSSSITTGSGN